jgi:hypothetical protein
MEGLILWLIWLLVMALVVYVVCRVIIWVLAIFELKDPKITQVIYAIGALIVLYWLVAGLLSWPPKPPSWPR